MQSASLGALQIVACDGPSKAKTPFPTTHMQQEKGAEAFYASAAALCCACDTATVD